MKNNRRKDEFRQVYGAGRFLRKDENRLDVNDEVLDDRPLSRADLDKMLREIMSKTKPMAQGAKDEAEVEERVQSVMKHTEGFGEAFPQAVASQLEQEVRAEARRTLSDALAWLKSQDRFLMEILARVRATPAYASRTEQSFTPVPTLVATRTLRDPFDLDDLI